MPGYEFDARFPEPGIDRDFPPEVYAPPNVRNWVEARLADGVPGNDTVARQTANQAVQNAATADGKAVSAQNAAAAADGKAVAAQNAAATADGKAVAAQRAAGVTPFDFGAVGDGVANDTAAIIAAFGSGKLVRGAGGIYRTTGTVTAPAGANIEGVSLAYDGPAEGQSLRFLGSGVRFSGCRVDGGNKAAWGIIDTTGGSTITECEVLNIRSETGSAIGIQSAGTGGTKITHNKIHHVHAVGNATAGDANGAARAIQIYANADLLLPCDIGWNEVWQITGEEGDGIHVLCINVPTFYSSAMTNIHNNTVWDCSKRCIKNQSSDARIADNSTRLTIAGGYSCIDCIDGANSVVSGNLAIVEVAGGRGIQMNGYAPAGVRLSGGRVTGNQISTFPGEAGIALNVRVVDDVVISGNTMVNGRMVADTADRLTVAGNQVINLFGAGNDGGISLRVSSLSCDVTDNTMRGGDAFSCVRIDGPGCKVTGNRNRSTGHATPCACYITSAGNTVTGNINAKAALAVIRYGGSVTEVDQISVANNVTMS